MTANPHSIDPSTLVAEHLERAALDALRWLLSSFVQALMSTEADAICGVGYGVRSPERTNSLMGSPHPALTRFAALRRRDRGSAASGPRRVSVVDPHPVDFHP
jgi:hypothetical protein